MLRVICYARIVVPLVLDSYRRRREPWESTQIQAAIFPLPFIPFKHWRLGVPLTFSCLFAPSKSIAIGLGQSLLYKAKRLTVWARFILVSYPHLRPTLHPQPNTTPPHLKMPLLAGHSVPRLAVSYWNRNCTAAKFATPDRWAPTDEERLEELVKELKGFYPYGKKEDKNKGKENYVDGETTSKAKVGVKGDASVKGKAKSLPTLTDTGIGKVKAPTGLFGGRTVASSPVCVTSSPPVSALVASPSFPVASSPTPKAPFKTWLQRCADTPSSASVHAPSLEERDAQLVEALQALKLDREWRRGSLIGDEEDPIVDTVDVVMPDVEREVQVKRAPPTPVAEGAPRLCFAPIVEQLTAPKRSSGYTMSFTPLPGPKPASVAAPRASVPVQAAVVPVPAPARVVVPVPVPAPVPARQQQRVCHEARGGRSGRRLLRAQRALGADIFGLPVVHHPTRSGRPPAFDTQAMPVYPGPLRLVLVPTLATHSTVGSAFLSSVFPPVRRPRSGHRDSLDSRLCLLVLRSYLSAWRTRSGHPPAFDFQSVPVSLRLALARTPATLLTVGSAFLSPVPTYPGTATSLRTPARSRRGRHPFVLVYPRHGTWLGHLALPPPRRPRSSSIQATKTHKNITYLKPPKRATPYHQKPS
ncbi:hypothetical protein C8R47DRAFT_1191450 [Mycena vitilis]|nr:hypothetical protein C8R47DRAFT_1191450 [Mycena vitilis]